uniref:Ribosome-recycling factor, mitochondrial n=1 Tax=Crassostrea virginica TaxID=6565 RepID=A0A8B8D622_CRAVI|nr:ribosome-recycling factor, mitochondrial-like [Crassostrea virginica]
MSRFAIIYRAVSGCTVRPNYAHKQLVATLSSLSRVPEIGFQHKYSCLEERRQFSISTLRMKKTSKKDVQKKKKSKTNKQFEDEDEEENEDFENNLEELVNMKSLEQEMEETLEHLQVELMKNITLRPSTAIYEDLSIETPDGRYPLNQLSQIGIQGPVVIINMAASPQYLKVVEDALRKELNLNPQTSGTTITLPVKKITKEYRHELVERVKKIAENSKDIIRHIRSKYIKELNAVKNKASKDAVFECTNKINAKAKTYTDKASVLAAKRSKEIEA